MRGVLLHRMSHAVVCALHAGVSRNRSARNPLFTCSSLGATSLKMIWDGETPRNKAFNMENRRGEEEQKRREEKIKRKKDEKKKVVKKRRREEEE
jgi:hypothetical protein